MLNITIPQRNWPAMGQEAPTAQRTPTRVVNAKGSTAELRLYEDIGDAFGGTSPAQVADELQQAGDVKRIDVRINSPGGDVFAGTTIYNLLVQHPAKVHVYVDGLAASIASLVAMAGDRIEIADNAMMMIHRPWSFVAGDSDELRAVADLLDKSMDALVGTYAKRTKQSRSRIAELMAGEAWMNAREAIDLGFADAVFEGQTIAARVDAGRYRNTPAALTRGTTPARSDWRAASAQRKAQLAALRTSHLKAGAGAAYSNGGLSWLHFDGAEPWLASTPSPAPRHASRR